MTYGPEDDDLHIAAMSDRWWETETCWFSFHNAERRLGGWLYTMIRPNSRTVSGGAWIWDDSASAFWEVPYYANHATQRLREGTDLRDCTLPNGVEIRVEEPLTRYRLGYTDAPRLSVELAYTAIMPPQPITATDSGFGNLSHFDQFGRITGRIVLHGEEIPIDCVSIRDRSWGPRPEHRPKRTAYVTAATADGTRAFLAVCDPGPGAGAAKYGFMLREGRAVALGATRRTDTRDPMTGFIDTIAIEGRDADGASFRAEGRPLSRIVINRHSFVDINSLIEWTFEDGTVAWGEDQDIWPVHEFSAMRRLSAR
ncbi:MAG: DUF7065 domain-containing protein [Sagittula sp.]|uniref:DUF7065 domain-containing protein n=1 Tax=Sagittula sp. TaxID=2038081 RepID=UPI004058975D